MIIGVTGTRLGATEAQQAFIQQRWTDTPPEALHHGGCDGVDWFVHKVALSLPCDAPMPIFIHPATGPAAKWTHPGALIESPGVTVLPAKPPLDRNHDIVDACDMLLVLPDGPVRLRSGTWATFRYARKIGKAIDVCYPGGYVAVY